MTKMDLIEALADSAKLPKARAETLIDAIFEGMAECLRRGERIEVRGFGSFAVRQYAGYDGRNPRTGVAVVVKPKRSPFFTVAKELKARVNATLMVAAAARPPRPPPGAAAP